jgi:hypothetical protein
MVFHHPSNIQTRQWPNPLSAMPSNIKTHETTVYGTGK